LVECLRDAEALVVCNSHQALAEWGFARSRVIWHGFDPQEFPEGRHDLDVLCIAADFHRPHYRGAWEQVQVERLLKPGIRIGGQAHPGAALELRGGNAFAIANFNAYVRHIGRYRAFLNTTLRSPMPRSRGEAMMTGVVPVCLRNHDVDRFIDNGVDGFYADTPEELAQFINTTFADPHRLAAMGKAARRKAMDLFNHDRFLSAWTELIAEALG
jgi:glycosyltransferase involved in cell wall biosynthesis